MCQDERKRNEVNKRRDMSAFCPISCTRLYTMCVFYDYETNRNLFSEVNSMFSLNVPECLNKVSSATPVYFGKERQTGECSAVLGSLTPV